MNLDFLRRCQKNATVLTCVFFAMIFVYIGKQQAFDYLVASAASILNIYIISRLTYYALVKRNVPAFLILLSIKLPVLYLLGFFYFKYVSFDFIPFILGFNTIFLVIVLKSIGAFIQSKRFENAH